MKKLVLPLVAIAAVSFCVKFASAADDSGKTEKVKGVLMNVFGGITRGDEVARGLVTARDNLQLKLPLVVRLSGPREEEGRQILLEHGIEPGASAWEAAQKIVELTKAGVR